MQDTSIHATGTWSIYIEKAKIICFYNYIIKNSTSINFTQEYFNIVLATISGLLYLQILLIYCMCLILYMRDRCVDIM